MLGRWRHEEMRVVPKTPVSDQGYPLYALYKDSPRHQIPFKEVRDHILGPMKPPESALEPGQFRIDLGPEPRESKVSLSPKP